MNKLVGKEVVAIAVQNGATLTITGSRNEFGGTRVYGELESASRARFVSASADNFESCIDMLGDQWDAILHTPPAATVPRPLDASI